MLVAMIVLAAYSVKLAKFSREVEEYKEDYTLISQEAPLSQVTRASNDLLSSLNFESDDNKIIKSGSLTVRVEDVRETIDALEALLSDWRANLLYLNLNRGSASYYANLQIQVPAQDFDIRMKDLSEIGLYVENEWSNSDDISDIYLDLEARLNNAYAEEAAYINLMDKAGSISEVLEVTKALSNIRADIESMEGRIAYYDDRIAYATIDLSLTEDERVSAIAEKWRPLSTFSNAFKDWLIFLQSLLDIIIYILIFGWPLLIILYFIWRWRPNIKKRQ